LATSAASSTDPLESIAAAAAAESPLWAEQLRADPERKPVFGPLVRQELALGVETIYEGYLVHYGRPRLFAPVDAETAILLGDYLYAHGLVHVSATGDLAAVATLAELISACAHLRAEEAPGDGEAWLAAARRLGESDTASQALLERAMAAHAERVG
jgi:hypothetical protein